MNQTAFEGLRNADMSEEQALVVAEHTDMSDVLAALAQQRHELRLEMSELKNALTWRLAVLVAVPVLLALVVGIVSVVANAAGLF